MDKKVLHSLAGYLNLKRSDISEDLLLKKVIVLTFLLHLIIYLWLTSSASISFPDEWSMETDLASFDLGEIKSSEESKYEVSDRMLPQLPKNFSIQDDAQKTDKDDMIDPTSKEEQEQEKLKKKEQEKDNLLAKNEALKRLAIERLRQQQKNNQKDKKELIRRLQGVDFDSLGGSGSGSGSSENDTYRAKLESHIKKFWVLPSGYDFQEQDIKVEISITLNGMGSMNKTQILKSSGNSVFDDFALTTLKNASPFPPPPQSLQGKSIKLIFTPKSF